MEDFRREKQTESVHEGKNTEPEIRTRSASRQPPEKGNRGEILDLKRKVNERGEMIHVPRSLKVRQPTRRSCVSEKK